MKAVSLHIKPSKRYHLVKTLIGKGSVITSKLKMDDTAYLMNSEPNRQALKESILQAERGEYKQINFRETCR